MGILGQFKRGTVNDVCYFLLQLSKSTQILKMEAFYLSEILCTYKGDSTKFMIFWLDFFEKCLAAILNFFSCYK